MLIFLKKKRKNEDKLVCGLIKEIICIILKADTNWRNLTEQT